MTNWMQYRELSDVNLSKCLFSCIKTSEAQLADEAVSKGYVDETIQQNLNTTLEGVIKFVSMTEAEYKALETKSPSTIYHLTDVSMWAIGNQEIVTSNMPA